MRVPLLDLTQQYRTLKGSILPAVEALCETQRFCLGPPVEQFEREVAAYTGAPFAVGCASGTDALLLALMAIDLQPGEEVITTPYTFFATAGSIARLGGLPRFVDIDPETCNLVPDRVREAVGSRTRAILPVHLFGQMADMEPILEIAQTHGLAVIEDACQALGATYRGKQAGTLGDVGCFSFFPSKNLGGFGDGGLVVTQDLHRAERIRALRGHGSHERYLHRWVGLNSRLDALQAVVLSAKLPSLDAWNEARRRHARYYDEALSDTPVRPLRLRPDRSAIYHQYVIRCPERDRLRSHLEGNGVGTAVYYPLPLHLQECFRGLGHGEGDFPAAEQASRETVALPIYPELTPEQRDWVVGSIRAFYGLGG